MGLVDQFRKTSCCIGVAEGGRIGQQCNRPCVTLQNLTDEDGSFAEGSFAECQQIPCRIHEHPIKSPADASQSMSGKPSSAPRAVFECILPQVPSTKKASTSPWQKAGRHLADESPDLDVSARARERLAPSQTPFERHAGGPRAPGARLLGCPEPQTCRVASEHERGQEGTWRPPCRGPPAYTYQMPASSLGVPWRGVSFSTRSLA